MSWKFNPPPGWPAQPEGWQPPPGWTPDPSWPPAPPGWQFWVPADSPPAGGAPASGAGAADQTIHEQPTSFANFGGPGSPAGQPSGPPAGPGSAEPPQGPAAGSASVPPAAPQPPPFGQPAGGAGSGAAQPFGQPASGAGSGAAQPFGQPPGQPPGPGFGQPQYGAGGAAQAPYVPIQQPAHRPWHQRWWAIAGIGLTVALVGCLGGTAVALVTDSDEGSNPPPQPQPVPPTEPAPSGGPTDGPGTGDLNVGEERTGEAPSIVTLNLPPDGGHMVTLSFTGSGFFQASVVDSEGESIEYLGSASEDYTGMHLIDVGLLRDQTVAGIDISSSDGGSWSVLLQSIEDAPVWPDQTEGSGNTVMQINRDEVSGEADVTGTHDGESNFIVWGYGPEDTGHSLLFNDIGQVPNPEEDVDDQSEQALTEEAIVLEIEADGNWTLEPN